jgi:hypothetical protein
VLAQAKRIQDLISKRAVVLKSSGWGGLGDLLLALELALGVAQASGRALVVDWRDTPYGRDGANLFDQLIEIRGVNLLPVSLLDDQQQDVEPACWQGRLHQPLRTVYGHFCPDRWNRAWASRHLDAGEQALRSEAAWVVIWNHQQPQLMRQAQLSCAARAGPTFAEAVQPVARLQELLHVFMEQTFGKAMIGVHARATLEAQEAGKSADVKRIKAVLKRLTRLHPGSGLFLACDNQAWIEQLRLAFPCIVTRSKWLPAPGEPLHLADHGELGGFGVAADALLDLMLLARCQQLVHPQASAFSIAASHLSGLDRACIHPIAPAGGRLQALRNVFTWRSLIWR